MNTQIWACKERKKLAKILASTLVKSKYITNVLGLKSKYIAVFKNVLGTSPSTSKMYLKYLVQVQVLALPNPVTNTLQEN